MLSYYRKNVCESTLTLTVSHIQTYKHTLYSFTCWKHSIHSITWIHIILGLPGTLWRYSAEQKTTCMCLFLAHELYDAHKLKCAHCMDGYRVKTWIDVLFPALLSSFQRSQWSSSHYDVWHEFSQQKETRVSSMLCIYLLSGTMLNMVTCNAHNKCIGFVLGQKSRI